MELTIILAAFTASLLTFFSGFGLGTILTPVFILFFPPELAVALTAMVHFANNLFKISLMGAHINWKTGIAFGAPSMIGAFLGARLLMLFAGAGALYSYEAFGTTFSVSPVKLVIGLLLIAFALLEVLPALKKIQFDEKKMIPGGLLSGFFGGLSGHQGALRSMFLIRSGLSKESFIATGIFIACAVDVVRLSIYVLEMPSLNLNDNLPLLAMATGSAFAGALLGKWFLKKITLGFLQWVVALLIFILGALMVLGVV